MAYDSLTVEERERKPRDVHEPPENERFLRACSDIASFLVQDYEASKERGSQKKDINLNSLRAKFAKKHRIGNIPPLTAIIAAIPENYKKYILPKLIAKPISMFNVFKDLMAILRLYRKCFWYSSCCCHV